MTQSNTSDPAEYLLDASIIIQHPEILAFSGDNIKLLILESTLAELIALSTRNKRHYLITELLRAIDVGAATVPDQDEFAYTRSEIARLGRKFDDANLQLAMYALHAKAAGHNIAIVSNDRVFRREMGESVRTISIADFLALRPSPTASANSRMAALLNIKRYAKLALISNVIASIGFGVASNVAYDYLSNLFIERDGVLAGYVKSLITSYYYIPVDSMLVTAILIMGVAVFWIRQRFRTFYGLAEIAVGVISGFNAIRSPILLIAIGSVTIQALGGLYIIVRGLDNFGKGIEGTPAGVTWQRIFR